MTIVTDYADPCAVLPRIREAYYALLEGMELALDLMEHQCGLCPKWLKKAVSPTSSSLSSPGSAKASPAPRGCVTGSSSTGTRS